MSLVTSNNVNIPKILNAENVNGYENWREESSVIADFQTGEEGGDTRKCKGSAKSTTCTVPKKRQSIKNKNVHMNTHLYLQRRCRKLMTMLKK